MNEMPCKTWVRVFAIVLNAPFSPCSLCFFSTLSWGFVYILFVTYAGWVMLCEQRTLEVEDYNESI